MATVSDTFVGNGASYAQLYSTVSGSAFNNIAYHFDVAQGINSDSTPGATHSAVLYTSPNNDTFVANGSAAAMFGSTPGYVFYFLVRGFNDVTAVDQGSGQAGVAYFAGVADDDQFVGTSSFALMTDGNANDPVQYRNVAVGFSLVTATAKANSQHTLASLYDSTGGNLFTGRANQGIFLNIVTVNFAQIDAYSTAGADVVNVANLDYIFRKLGNWTN